MTEALRPPVLHGPNAGGSHVRPGLLLSWLERNSRHDRSTVGAMFWQAVMAQWSLFDAIPHAAYARAFQRWADLHRPEYMPSAALEFWQGLPSDDVTVWRGQDLAAGRQGLSWTTNREVALGYAMGRRTRNETPALYSAVVTWTDIAFACVDRRENEIVLFSPPDDWMGGPL